MAKSCVHCGGKLDDKALCVNCARNPRAEANSANARGTRDASDAPKQFSFSAIARYHLAPNRVYMVEGYGDRLDFRQTGRQLAGGMYITAADTKDPSKLILIGLALVLGSVVWSAAIWHMGYISGKLILFAAIGLVILSQGFGFLLSPVPKVGDNHFSVWLTDIDSAELFTIFNNYRPRRLTLQLRNGEKIDLQISDAADMHTIKHNLLPLLGSRVQVDSVKERPGQSPVLLTFIFVVLAGLTFCAWLMTTHTVVSCKAPSLTGDVSGCLLTVYVSTDDSVQGTPIGSHSWGEDGNNMHFSCALTPAVKNYLHIQVQPPENSRVFFGYFTLNGGPKFASTGSTILDSRPESWQVSLNGWGTGYRTPAVAPSSKAYTSQDPTVDHEDPNAQTLMDPVAGVTGQQNVYFSTVINP